MPVYIYKCLSCDKHFDLFQHYTDDPLTVCPECKQVTLQKVYNPPAVHYKGEGWYYDPKSYDPGKVQ
jgi:putative FmdB family regulatory protein